MRLGSERRCFEFQGLDSWFTSSQKGLPAVKNSPQGTLCFLQGCGASLSFLQGCVKTRPKMVSDINTVYFLHLYNILLTVFLLLDSFSRSLRCRDDSAAPRALADCWAPWISWLSTTILKDLGTQIRNTGNIDDAPPVKEERRLSRHMRNRRRSSFLGRYQLILVCDQSMASTTMTEPNPPAAQTEMSPRFFLRARSSCKV